MKLLAVFLLLGTPLFAGEKSKPDPRLRELKTIFITGNNKQAAEARRKMAASNACFTLAPAATEASAVLEVKEAQEDGLLHTRGASAELTLKSGEMIWSDYRMAGGDRVMWQLIHDACH